MAPCRSLNDGSCEDPKLPNGSRRIHVNGWHEPRVTPSQTWTLLHTSCPSAWQNLHGWAKEWVCCAHVPECLFVSHTALWPFPSAKPVGNFLPGTRLLPDSLSMTLTKALFKGYLWDGLPPFSERSAGWWFSRAIPWGKIVSWPLF